MAYTLVNMPAATSLVAIPSIPLSSVVVSEGPHTVKGGGLQADYALTGTDRNRKILLSIYSAADAKNDTRRMSVTLTARAVQTNTAGDIVSDRPFRVNITVDKPSLTEGDSDDVLGAVLTAVSAFFHAVDSTTKVPNLRVINDMQADLLAGIFAS